MNKEVDLEADTIKVALLNNSHTFTASDDVWGDVSANEISATGYTAGGDALTTKSVTQAATTKFDADDTVWTITGAMSTYHAVIVDVTATSNLMASIDFGGEQTVTDANFTIKWHADGIITLA